jgi:rubredoxin
LKERIVEVEKELKSLKPLKASLKDNQETISDEKKELYLKCKYCDYKFRKAIGLEKHMIKHGVAMDFNCEVCGFIFIGD